MLGFINLAMAICFIIAGWSYLAILFIVFAGVCIVFDRIEARDIARHDQQMAEIYQQRMAR